MKAKLTMVVTYEYEMNPEYYPTDDPKEMLKVDIDNYSDDPHMLLEAAFEQQNTEIKGEIVE